MEKQFNEYTAKEQVPILLMADEYDSLLKTLDKEQCLKLVERMKKDIKILDMLQELVMLYT